MVAVTGVEMEPTQRRAPAWRRTILAFVLLGATAAGIALSGGELLARLVTQRWLARIETAPDEVALVSGLAVTGDHGIDALVGLLGSKNDESADAARSVLMAEVDRWRLLDLKDYAPKVARLAEALAGHVDEFGPAARQDAARFAELVLLEFQAAVRGRVATDCERILRASMAGQAAADSRRSDQRGHSLLDGEPSGMPVRGPDDFRLTPTAPIRPLESAAPAVNLGNVPGGAIPLELSLATVSEAKSFHSDAPSTGSDTVEEESPMRSHDHGPKPSGGVVGSPDPDGGRSPVAVNSELHLEPPMPSAAPLASDTTELMRQLQTPAAVAAAAELVRRGFGPVQLELARRLFDPDPESRKQLLRLLPGIQSIDPLPWILQLCRDENAEVRLMAVTLAATSGDPALVAEAERIAQQDSDPRLQFQSRRIAEQRSQRFR